MAAAAVFQTPELLISIFQYLEDDPKTLAVLMQVSPTCHIYSRALLWKSIELASFFNVYSVPRRQEYANDVKEVALGEKNDIFRLSCQRNEKRNVNIDWNHLTTMRFPKLRSVTYAPERPHQNGGLAPYRLANLIQPELRRFRYYTRLTMSSSTLQHIARTCHSLEEFEVSWVVSQTNGVKLLGGISASRAVKLFFKQTKARDSLRFICLDANMHYDEAIMALNEIMKYPNLEELIWTNTLDEHTPSDLERPGHVFFPKLKSLTIGVKDRRSVSALKSGHAVAELLKQCPALTKLTVVVHNGGMINPAPMIRSFAELTRLTLLSFQFFQPFACRNEDFAALGGLVHLQGLEIHCPIGRPALDVALGWLVSKPVMHNVLKKLSDLRVLQISGFAFEFDTDHLRIISNNCRNLTYLSLHGDFDFNNASFTDPIWFPNLVALLVLTFHLPRGLTNSSIRSRNNPELSNHGKTVAEKLFRHCPLLTDVSTDAEDVTDYSLCIQDAFDEYLQHEGMSRGIPDWDNLVRRFMSHELWEKVEPWLEERTDQLKCWLSDK